MKPKGIKTSVKYVDGKLIAKLTIKWWYKLFLVGVAFIRVLKDKVIK